MSCSTLNQQLVRMTVSAGALPEGFCPQSWQDAFDSIVQRIIVTPNVAFTSFAAGSVEPTSNVGPWFKDCEEFFIWDDNTSRYIPMEKGGFNSLAVMDSSGDFNVPEFIYRVKVELWAGGGGGHDDDGGNGGGTGGGGGGYASSILTVLPGQNIPVIVGSGGGPGAPGLDGGDSSFMTVIARGGKGGGNALIVGEGGQYNGALYGVYGGSGSSGNATVPGTGGDAGGAGGAGGQFVNTIGSGGAILPNGVIPGGGGAGGKTAIQAAGSGARGRVLIWY